MSTADKILAFMLSATPEEWAAYQANPNPSHYDENFKKHGIKAYLTNTDAGDEQEAA